MPHKRAAVSKQVYGAINEAATIDYRHRVSPNELGAADRAGEQTSSKKTYLIISLWFMDWATLSFLAWGGLHWDPGIFLGSLALSPSMGS